MDARRGYRTFLSPRRGRRWDRADLFLDRNRLKKLLLIQIGVDISTITMPPGTCGET